MGKNGAGKDQGSHFQWDGFAGAYRSDDEIGAARLWGATHPIEKDDEQSAKGEKVEQKRVLLPQRGRRTKRVIEKGTDQPDD